MSRSCKVHVVFFEVLLSLFAILVFSLGLFFRYSDFPAIRKTYFPTYFFAICHFLLKFSVLLFLSYLWGYFGFLAQGRLCPVNQITTLSPSGPRAAIKAALPRHPGSARTGTKAAIHQLAANALPTNLQCIDTAKRAPPLQLKCLAPHPGCARSATKAIMRRHAGGTRAATNASTPLCRARRH